MPMSIAWHWFQLSLWLKQNMLKTTGKIKKNGNAGISHRAIPWAIAVIPNRLVSLL